MTIWKNKFLSCLANSKRIQVGKNTQFSLKAKILRNLKWDRKMNKSKVKKQSENLMRITNEKSSNTNIL